MRKFKMEAIQGHISNLGYGPFKIIKASEDYNLLHENLIIKTFRTQSSARDYLEEIISDLKVIETHIEKEKLNFCQKYNIKNHKNILNLSIKTDDF